MYEKSKIFSISLFGCIILNLIIYQDKLEAQWQPDLRLTNNSALSNLSNNNARCIASSGNDVHVVWYDDRDGNNEIYYRRSTNEGFIWTSESRLTINNFESTEPSIAVSGLTVHIAWVDTRDGNAEIYYKRSPDGGLSWGQDTRLTNNSLISSYPSISVSGSAVHIVWEDTRDANYEIYYKRSTNGGLNWGTDTRLTNNSFSSRYPSVSVSGSVVHVALIDDRNGNYEIYYKRSPDIGVSWGADIRLTNNTFNSSRSCISSSDLAVHVVWEDNRDGNYEIYSKRSIDGGLNWGTDTRLTNNSFSSGYSSVSVSGPFVHVAWSDNRDGNFEIYYRRSTDAGINWGADTRLTNFTLSSMIPSVAVSGTVVHVVWQDERNGNPEIYYKRDLTGNSIGIHIINSEVPKEFSLSQNYPNPFNPVTKIRFELPNSSGVKLVVYNALGKEIETIVNEQLNRGTYEVDWNAANYSSGTYFYRLVAGEYTDTKKMVLVK